MRKLSYTRILLMLFMLLAYTGVTQAQVTTNGGSGLASSYPTLNDAITALNSATISSPVTITLTANETAPAGGYNITASGTSANAVTLDGGGFTVTAGLQAANGRLDAIFKIVGGDYITIQNFTMAENTGNTVTAVATNTMTEFGVALFYGTATDGAQNNTIKSNTIALSATYQNAIGIYSNTTHSATSFSAAANATANSGLNSNLKIYNNTISNVAFGIQLITPVNTATLFESGIDIGGTSAATANTISYGSNTAADGGWNAFSATSCGIGVRNASGVSIRYNNITSGSMTIASTGILLSSSTAPANTYTNTISNNTVTVNQTGTVAATGINFGYGTSSGTIIGNNNTVVINQTVSAAASGAQVGINAAYASATNTLGNNTVTISQANNGSATAISGAVTGITAAGAGTTVNVTANTVTIKQAAPSASGTYTGAVTFIDLNAASGTINATGNTINTAGGTVRSTGTLKGFNQDASVTTLVNIKNNIANIDRVAASGSVYFQYTSTTPSDVADSISSNTITFTNLSGSTSVCAILSTGGPSAGATKSICNNTINISGTNTGTVIGVAVAYGNGNVNGNIITVSCATTAAYGIDFSSTNAYALTAAANSISFTTTGASPTIYGIYATYSGPYQIYNNTFPVLSASAAGSSAPSITAIYVSAGTGDNIYGNIINNITTGAGSGSATIRGIAVAGGTSVNVYRNKIYDLSTSNTGTSTVISDIAVSGGTTVNVYNNLISQSNALTGVNSADAVRGISITQGSSSAANVYYNTVFLNASSTGTNFGTSGIYATASATSTTAALDLRNNIVLNLSTPAGTGITAAYRRSGTALGNYASTSNRNLFYAGAPGASRLIMYDGTNSYQAMTAYQTTVTARDANSFTGESFTYTTAGSFFQSLTPANTSFLKPVAGIITQAESGGISITGITDDYSGVTRPASGTAPDLGAWEFAGTMATPVITLNTVTPGAATQCAATARVVNVTVTTAAGTISGVVLNYNNGTAGSTPMTLVSGSTYTGTIPAASPVNAIVSWSVTATNSFGISTTYNGTGYQDAPLTGTTATATASAATVCAGSNDTLTAALTASYDTASLGIATTTSTSAAANPFYGGYGGVKTQYIVKASELTAAGFLAGPISSLGINITSAGSTLSGFAVSIDTTSLTAMTGTMLTVNNSVYAAASFVPVNGVNTFNFSTPFTWDGVSNIVLSFCWSNNNTSNTASTVSVNSPGFTASGARYVDSRTAAEVCSYTGSATPSGWNGGSTTSSNRPVFVFGGVKKKNNITVAWSNGTTTVGTNNPQIVNPVATTTYNAVITYAGCTATTNNVTVTTAPLPTAPTATNSNQCGTQMPTAAVADPNGYTAPVFKWYAATTGGTALQASTSTTYTTAIAATTTFYVSVTNPATGCESGRTAVTVTVSTPDAITAKANGVTSGISSCMNSAVSLAATQTGTTNNYTYTWTAIPASGSGIATSASGQNISVTPTAAGIYTYTVTAVDGSCATTATVTDTVRNPFAYGPVTAVASQPSTCAGGNDTLRAYYIGADTSTVGTQSTTDLGSGVYRYGYGTGDFRHQLLYTAAEMNAAGFTAGNINALGFKVTAVGSGSGNNYTIKMSNVTATALTGTFVVPSSATTVYTAATYTPVNGLNQHVFSTPFNWDGTSNILVDICYNVSVTGSSATMAVNTPAAVSNTSLLGSAGACTAASGATTYAFRPLTWFNGNRNTTAPAVTWSNGTTTVGSNNPQIVNPLVNTSYTATVTVNGCSATAAPVAVTIVPLSGATVTATANTICAGQNDTLTASATGAGAPFTYSWSDGAAVVGTTKTIVVSPGSTKTYTVTITNTCTQTATASKTITVNPVPTATAASNSPVCEGGTLNLTGTTDIGTTFTWTGPNNFSATGQNPSIANVAATAAGVYTFKSTANGCTSPAATATVVVNATPAPITVTPAAATICAGTVQLLTATGGNIPDQSILAENFNGTTNNWVTTNASTGGSFALSAWTLRPYPYTYYGPLATATFTSNDNSQFYLSNSDTAGTGSVTSTMLQSPAFSTVGATNAYVDFFHYYRAWTIAANDSATVELSSDGTNWTAARTFKGTSRGTSTAFAHDTVSLNAYLGLPAVYVRFHYTTTYGYYWAIDNVTVRGTVQPKPIWTPVTNLYTNAAGTTPYTAGTATDTIYAKPAANTTYTASYTTAAGCSSAGSAVITVNPLPNATVTGAAAICVNATATLTPATTGGTWSSSNPAIATVSSAGVVTGIAAGTDTIRYHVTNVNGCTDSSMKIVTVNALPNASVTGSSAVCINSTITLTPATTGGTWTSTNTAIATVSSTGIVTGVAAGTDTVRYKVTNAGGCTDSVFKVITVNPAPNAAITGLTTLCVNDTTTLAGATSGGTWTSSNIAIATVNSTTGLVTGMTAGIDTITYTVNNGCTASATHIITIKPLPALTVTANGPTTFCDGDSVKLTAHATGVTYQWSNAGGPISGATDSVYRIETSGVFTVKISATNGCSNTTAPQTVTVNPLPVPVITANGVDMTTGTFTTYQWNFGGSPIPNANSQNYTATQNGDYTVTVTDGNGCAGTSAIYKMSKVGIEEHGGQGTVRIYPNPTKDVVYIDAPVPVNITVYSLDGRKIAYAEKAKSIDLGKFAAGTYTIMITDETASFKVVQRIVKAE